jgi:hypothetical protein
MSLARPHSDQTDHSAPHSSLILGEEKREATIIDIENIQPLESLKEAKSKLMLCIALLESQIKSQSRKKKVASVAAKGFYYTTLMGMLSVVGSSMHTLISNEIAFDNAVSQFDTTMEHHPFGMKVTRPIHCSYLVDFTNSQKQYFGDLTKNICLDVLQQTLIEKNLDCAPAVRNICDNPKLETVNAPILLLLPGIIIPALIAINMLMCRKIATKGLEELSLHAVPRPKIETIQRYAEKYGITFLANASLHEIKALFEYRLNHVNAYLSRHSIMMGSKEKSAPIHRLFDHRQGGDPNILRDIFKYAALDPTEAEMSIYHHTLALGSHVKNARSARGLYSFFQALNKRDHNNDLIYDRKKIIRNILEYARPEGPIKRYK